MAVLHRFYRSVKMVGKRVTNIFAIRAFNQRTFMAYAPNEVGFSTVCKWVTYFNCGIMKVVTAPKIIKKMWKIL